MHLDAAHLLAAHLAFAEVDARSQLQTHVHDRRANGPGTGHAGRWPIEGGKERVTRCVNFVATVPRQLLADRRSIATKERSPPLVPELDEVLGRAHDVCEEQNQQGAPREEAI